VVERCPIARLVMLAWMRLLEGFAALLVSGFRSPVSESPDKVAAVANLASGSLHM
jgi:hypothetical protein